PAYVADADHGDLADSLVPRDQFLDLQRRDPFAAALDHVLDPVRDLQATRRVDVADVAGMEIAAGPQRLRSFRIPPIARRQPGCADDDLTDGPAIMRYIAHGLVHDPQVDERQMETSPRARRTARRSENLASAWANALR